MARPRLALEDILNGSSSDDDDDQQQRADVPVPARSAREQQRSADLQSILAAAHDSDEDSDEDATSSSVKAPVTSAAVKAPVTAAAAPKATPATTVPVPAPAKPAPAAAKATPAPAPAAALAPATAAPVAAKAAVTSAGTLPSAAPALVGGSHDSASAAASKPSSKTSTAPSSPAVSVASKVTASPAKPSASARAPLPLGDSDSDEDVAALVAKKPVVASISPSVAAPAAVAAAAAADVPLAVPRRQSSAAAPTDADGADAELPPARTAVRKVSLGARALSGGSESSPTTPQVSDHDDKAAKQLARQQAKEQMLRASKPSSPAGTPPNGSRRTSFKGSADLPPMHSGVTHNILSFDTIARAGGPVSSAASVVTTVAHDSASDSDDDALNTGASGAHPSAGAAGATKSANDGQSAREKILLANILNNADSDDEDDVPPATGLSIAGAGVAAAGSRPSSLPKSNSGAGAALAILNSASSSLSKTVRPEILDSSDDEDEPPALGATKGSAAAAAAAARTKTQVAAANAAAAKEKEVAPVAAASVAPAAEAKPAAAAASTPAGPSQGGGQLMSEADLMLIANPLTRAEVLEQNLSTLGNYTVLNPLSSSTSAAGKARNTTSVVPGKDVASGLPVPANPASCANLVRLSGLDQVQLELTKSRPNVGVPTACCLHTHSKFLCVGTSRGVVLLFDRGFQKLLMGLGKVDDAAARARGSITCLDLNVAGDVLLVGYSRGSVCVWDITHKSLIKVIPDASSLPITCVKFSRLDPTNKSWTFMAADSAGCLNLFILTKQLFNYGLDKQVLLQGKAGPVLASSVLTSTPAFPHPADRMALVAIATEAVTSVVSLEPQVQIVYRTARESTERVGVQPCLAWRPLHPRDECLSNAAFMNSPDGSLVSEAEAELVRHPTLLVCRGRSLSLLQAVPMDRAEQIACNSKVPLKFRTIASQSIGREIKSCSWLANGQLIVLILAPTDDILILDPFSSPLQCVSTLSGASIGIVHQEFFHHPTTGVPELTFAPSIHATDDCLLLLGIDTVTEVRVLPWGERLDAFIHGPHCDDNPQWHHCLSLALDLFNGVALSPFSLPRDRATVQRTMQMRMCELISNFIRVSMGKTDLSRPQNSSGGEIDLLTGTRPTTAITPALANDKRYVKVLAATCIAYCIAINRLDVLFGEIFSLFRTHFPHAFAGVPGSAVAPSSAASLLSSLNSACPVPLGSELFLELLEGWVLTDQLVTLPVPVLQELFSLYHFKRRLPQLEQMLLHLNPLSLDLGWLLPMCKSYRLFSACIYMYNRGHSAFHSPLDEVLGVLTDPANLKASSGSLSGFTTDIGGAQGNIVGPLGPISESEKSAMAYKLLLYIDYCFLGHAFPRKGDLPREYRAGVRAQVLSVLFRKTVRIGNGGVVALPDYPYLSYFLNLHTKQFLSILAIVFEDGGDDEWMQYIDTDPNVNAAPAAAVPEPQPTPPLPAAVVPPSPSASATSSAYDGSSQGSNTPNSEASHSRTPSAAASTASGFMSFLSTALSPTAAPPTAMAFPGSPAGQGAPVDPAAAAASAAAAAAAAAQPPPKRPATQYLKATGVPSRQQILDALLFLILDQLQSSPPASSTSHAAMMLPFTYQPHPSHLHELFKFAATYLARGVVTASKHFIQRIFLYLCANESAPSASPTNKVTSPTGGASAQTSASSAVNDFVRDRAERQKMLLSLLGRVPLDDGFDVEALQKQALLAGFHGVCIVLHIKKREFARTLEAFLRGLDAKDGTVLPNTLLHAARSDPRETAALQAVVNKPLVAAMFDYIHQALQDTSLAANQVAAIRTATLQALPQLVSAHSERTARLILEDFLSDHDRVVAALSAFPQLQFLYLKSIMTGHQVRADGSSGGGDDAPAGDVTSSSNRLGAGELSMTELLQRSGLQFTPRMHELYIRLLCTYARNDVLSHLSSHHDYNIESALKLCQEFHIDDASAFLLERTGDVQGALELTLQAVDARLVELRQLIEAEWRNFPEPKTPSDVQSLSVMHTLRRQSSADETVLHGAGQAAGSAAEQEASSLVMSPSYLALDRQLLNSISTATLLCQRSNDPEKLWFALLDRFVTLQRTIKAQHEDKNAAPVSKQPSVPTSKATAALMAPMSYPVFLYLSSALFSYVRLVLSSMMQHLDLAQLIHKITTDHQGDSLREFRETIQGLLDTYSYEQSILTTANALLSSDKFHSIELLQRKKAQAFQPHSDACEICARPMADGQFVAKFILFDCGHFFHNSCLGKNADSCMICQRDSASKKRANSRTTTNDRGQAPPALQPLPSPSSGRPAAAASPVSSSSGSGGEQAALEVVHRLQLAERKFERGTLRSVSAFNTKLKRFGRAGLDDLTTNDDEFTGAKPASNPFGESAAPETYGDDENEYFSFELPSTRSELIGAARQPGAMSKPQVVTQMRLDE